MTQNTVKIQDQFYPLQHAACLEFEIAVTFEEVR